MKNVNLLIALLSVCILLVSCKEDDTPSCEDAACNNGGICNEDGFCDCPDGYTGITCESFDPSQVQVLLDQGITPLELVEDGVPIENLYRKVYKGGLIFYLDTSDGTGLLAAQGDQGGLTAWGCSGTDISGLNNIESPPTFPETVEGAKIGYGAANTDAILANCTTEGIPAQLCRNLGENWFLPSREELTMMHANLNDRGAGGFVGTWYWSSTEENDNNAWSLFFAMSREESVSKGQACRVRAAKAF